MKILWLTNAALPEASKLMNEPPIPFGGWLFNAAKDLSEKEGLELSVAFPREGATDIHIMKGEKINYYAFPSIDCNQRKLIEENQFLKSIICHSNPDLVHIFGTEYAHTLAMVNICNELNLKSVISIQGLTSIYSQHYMAGLPADVQNSSTFRDVIRQDNLRQQQRKFVERGKNEVEALKKVLNVIGRTTWDKACTSQINPKARYYFCNETLRSEFYHHQWDIDQCEKHSIFVSQGNYPIKGLHFMLEAMPLILKSYPDAKLYIAGDDITKSRTLKQKLRLPAYAKYIRKIIQENNLQKHLVFTGILDENQMCERFLKANVFVSPSSIENSPNSLGEGMILGVPCVASNVGGVSDMLKHQKAGFSYQYDAPYMLAYYVCKVFEDESLVLEISKCARENALKTHDKTANTKQLMDIYNNICKQ